MRPLLGTFIRLTLVVTAAIVALFVAVFVLKIVLVAAIVAAVIIGGLFLYNFFVRRPKVQLPINRS